MSSLAWDEKEHEEEEVEDEEEEKKNGGGKGNKLNTFKTFRMNKLANF